MIASATVPRSAGNGAALIVVALNAAINLLAAVEKQMLKVRVAPSPAAAVRDRRDGIWHLYRIVGGSDSVAPEVSEYLNRD
ncbi:MAG TPA: hypothetical protein VIM12_03080 [Noviherbaspirillum sp.]|jgi:hypothetical protein|uniref:hypothetical protein n=1 Tax=Noviherbaspirillum sp. TaxID=1926288 RepID=UPI002F91C481